MHPHLAKIEDLLHRRPDLSTFLVHLTRRQGATSAAENLLRILERSEIEARTPFGQAKGHERHLGGTAASQRAVCFTETPLEHIWMMLEEIEGRAVCFEPYGLVLTKTTGRRLGLNPVWYSDISRRGVTWPATAVNQLVTDAVARWTDASGRVDDDHLAEEPIFLITPYFEQMGPIAGGRKEFWWEREWRGVGNVRFEAANEIAVILAPESEHPSFCAALSERGGAWANRPILDPRWGMERMLASLANVPQELAGPFPPLT